MDIKWTGKDRRTSGELTRRADDFVCIFHNKQSESNEHCFSIIKNDIKDLENEMKVFRTTISEKLVSWRWFSLIVAIMIAVFSGTATIGGFVARDLNNRMIISNNDVDSALARTNSLMNDMSNRQMNLMSNQNQLMRNQKALLKFFDLDPESANRKIKIK